MKNLNLFTKTIALCKGILLLIFIGSTLVPAYAETVNLRANFRLYGEVSRFGLGYGDMALHFGVNVPVAQLAPTIGTFGFHPGGTPFATGVLLGLSLSQSGFIAVDREFSVPFSIDVDQPASLYVGFGDNGISGFQGGSIQVIFDFSDNIWFVGCILCGNILPDQGLSLVSVTLADGTPLADVGLQFEFIPENTVLTAGASAADAGAISPVIDIVTPLTAPFGNRAQVFVPYPSFKGTATAKLRGGWDRGRATDQLINLDVNPEPDPLVYDLAFATVSGSNNVKLTRSVPPPPTNTPPVANAGPNVTIASGQQCQTVIVGQASDPDNDPLQYRWLEGEMELSGWSPVWPDGTASLNLCPLFLSVGQHTLTIEVSDGKATSSSSMILTVDNSAPNAGPTGGGTYEIGTPITVGGQVSDFDGDLLTYMWSEGATIYCNGPSQIQSTIGGTPVDLPDCRLPALGLGIHAVALTVSDEINQPVSRAITINVVDTGAPTLAPTADPMILWPPNHKMVKIAIKANAQDNSGLPVKLGATVSSNEPEEGLGDGDMTPDWTTPVIDQATGVITLQLRAERSGLGNGRTYTVTINAIDEAGNTSIANVEIVVPHDQRKK